MSFPVFMYHEVNSEAVFVQLKNYLQDKYFVREATFAGQMEFLKKQGCQTVLPGDISSISENKVILSFDDGYEGNYICVLPILKKYGFKAIFFVTAGWVGQPYMLTWQQIKEMSDAGMEIGSHTFGHAILGNLKPAQITEELKRSKEVIENHILKEVQSLSFPNGNYSKQVQKIAMSLDYKYLFCSSFGYWAPAGNTAVIPRIVATEDLADFTEAVKKNKAYILKCQFMQAIKAIPTMILGKSLYNRLYLKLFKLKEMGK
ncbi:MAG: polysaccharide deacetylase family protein [bacterium]|nr:polysaccharide deacetylase family protein [bacterium]MDD5757125.1 polysaccharide deacetylase family protein [bacterium]